MNELVKFAVENFLGGLKGNVVFTRNERTVIDNFEIIENGDETVFSAEVGCFEYFRIIAKANENSVIFSLDCKHAHGDFNNFQPENCINFNIGGGAEPEAIRYFYHRYTCCLEPEYCESFSALGNRTHTALLRYGDTHYNILALQGDEFICAFDGAGYHISFNATGYRSATGTFLSVTKAEDPFKAIKNNYRFARENGGIKVPLKEERILPDIFKGLGYCTFNTYDLDITEEKVLKKLDEYKAAGVPLNWVLIDDGWMTYTGQYMQRMKIDPDKFPHGLKWLVDTIKNDYGVKHVGIWIAIEAYWRGLEEGSEAFHEMRDMLMRTREGHWIPGLYDNKAYEFFDKWFGYLGESGIDFVKIDSQSQFQKFIEGEMATLLACRSMHDMIERAAAKHFIGGVHNCMGMDIENVYSRPMSAVSRNSHDFDVNPQWPYESTREFVVVNAWGSIWHDMMYYADFDMWWSSDEWTGEHNAVLRAIHDGPNYLSDPGPCNAEIVSHAVGDNGEHELPDHGAYPTLDCVYEYNPVFKVWNQCGENFAFAVYNFVNEDITETFNLSVVPDMCEDVEYVAYEYFSKTFTRVKRNSDITTSLKTNALAVYSLYPVKTDGNGEYIMLGDTNKYISAKTEKKTKTYLSEIIK